MFVLDTNVVSELMRSEPEPLVSKWIGQRSATRLFFTAVGEAELRYGLEILARGARREALAAKIDVMIQDKLRDRVLPFDSAAANAYAEVAARRRTQGRSVSHADCQIAAIARCRNAAVVTRNVRDFEETGVEIINPWSVVEDNQ
jgi:hypothetical protein